VLVVGRLTTNTSHLSVAGLLTKLMGLIIVISETE
jgi:hypothetical protein